MKCKASKIGSMLAGVSRAPSSEVFPVSTAKDVVVEI